MTHKNLYKAMSSMIAVSMALAMTACSANTEINSSGSTSKEEASAKTEAGTAEEIVNDNDGEHAIEVDGESTEYSNIKVVKTGDSDDGDEADFYGDNAAIFATNGATLTLSDITVETDGTHANAVFSYGEGTTVNISNSEISTTGNCSGGLMTCGGGTMNAENLNIHTTGNSSAAIRSDRGGGTVNVTGGSYTTDGKGSPVIYSTADITVSDAKMESTSSQGVVVEGKNSVTLKNVDLIADNNSKNSDKSDYYQAVMIYQSMSGDAAQGKASFTIEDSDLTNANGDIFFVTNTVADINLSSSDIVNNGDGVFLRAATAGWGNEGNNGGQVTLNADDQKIDGDIVVDDVSVLNMYLDDGSEFTGAINTDGQAGDVYVEISDDSTWSLTGDSYISALTCDSDAIKLNGYKLYVNGEEYNEGTATKGDAIEIMQSSSEGGMPEGKADGEMGNPPEMPNGEMPDGEVENPPEMPSGEKPDGNPPEKPSGEKPDGEPPAKRE